MRRAIHPQTSAADPQAVRWVTDTGDLPVGRVWRAPGTLGPLLEFGAIPQMFLEKGSVWTWLMPGKTWAEHGPRIRDAISAALELPGWQVEEGSAELLGLIARDVIDGELADYIASHGGIISVVDTTADTLRLDFGGACEGCPAAGTTMHDRIESAVAARYPMLRSITRTTVDPQVKGFLGIPGVRGRC